MRSATGAGPSCGLPGQATHPVNPNCGKYLRFLTGADTKHRVVDEAFRETDVRLVSMSALGRRVIASAYREGWVAGERVNLNRPMPGSGQDLLG
jgi:hypothetical protein